MLDLNISPYTPRTLGEFKTVDPSWSPIGVLESRFGGPTVDPPSGSAIYTVGVGVLESRRGGSNMGVLESMLVWAVEEIPAEA